MLNLRQPPQRAWPDYLRKFGDSDHWPEAFEPWWARHSAELAHLHPQIAEQWVHRHFDETWFSFIPLSTLRWRTEAWESAAILHQTHLERDQLNPERDFEAFNKAGMSTAIDFNINKTWTMPPIVLETPHGVVSWDHGDQPDVRYVLIEGHKRLRYLAGTLHAGQANGPHEVFVVSSPIADASRQAATP